MSANITMRRGGKHPILGYYAGGCPINDNYELSRTNPFKYTSQLRSVKQLSSNETRLIDDRASVTSMKFDGSLELNESSPSTEMNKEQFFQAVSDNVNFYGLQTFFYLPFDRKMTYLVKNVHLFTMDSVTQEHESRLIEPPVIYDSAGTETADSVQARFRCYDEFEKYDFSLSRLAIESLITLRLREAISVRFSHIDDFDALPGNIYFMMVLETCNISLTMDVKEAENSFNELKLSDYSGENISALATDALKLIKIMSGSYALDVRIGSNLLKKVSSTSSDYFNRTIFGHLDKAHRMEDKYMLKDPGLLKKDPLYSKYGPIAVCGILQEEYGRLYKEKDWPALTATLQSNNITTVTSSRKSEKKKPHQKQTSSSFSSIVKSLNTSSPTNSLSSEDPSVKYPWKYIHPTDENQTMVMDNKTWKFCKHCVCRHTKKKGFYNLSHTSSEHIDDYRKKNNNSTSTTPSINLSASVLSS